jgi:hypothetical protein
MNALVMLISFLFMARAQRPDRPVHYFAEDLHP